MPVLNSLPFKISFVLLLVAGLAGGCSGDNSGIGKRDTPVDAASPDDAGFDTSESNDIFDAGPDGGSRCAVTDAPDPGFEDADCDGIDGDRDASVFWRATATTPTTAR